MKIVGATPSVFVPFTLPFRLVRGMYTGRRQTEVLGTADVVDRVQRACSDNKVHELDVSYSNLSEPGVGVGDRHEHELLDAITGLVASKTRAFTLNLTGCMIREAHIPSLRAQVAGGGGGGGADTPRSVTLCIAYNPLPAVTVDNVTANIMDGSCAFAALDLSMTRLAPGRFITAFGEAYSRGDRHCPSLVLSGNALEPESVTELLKWPPGEVGGPTLTLVACGTELLPGGEELLQRHSNILRFHSDTRRPASRPRVPFVYHPNDALVSRDAFLRSYALLQK